MAEVKILSAKILKGGEKVAVSFKQTAPVAGKDGFDAENRPHPDLVAAFQALGVHMAILADYIKPKDAKKADLEKYVVTSYHYCGKDDAPAVKIMGYKLTSYGTCGINPSKVLLEEGDNEYPLLNDLLDKLKDVDAEVVLYLGGKKAPDPQQSLFPDDEVDDKVTNIQIDEPEDGEENYDDEEDVFSGDGDEGKQPAGSSKGRSTGLPQADPEVQQRVKEWTPGQYAKEIGAGDKEDEEIEKEEKKKRGRKVAKK